MILPPSFSPIKKEIIDFAFSECLPKPKSFADLGGVWAVDGAYTFYTIEQYKTEKAYLVDTNFSENFIKKSLNENSLLTINGNFGDKNVSEKIGKVDAIFLFDVLLHQVNPNWDDILKMYSEYTNYFIIFNQQWIGAGSNVRLLDLGKEEYFKNVPHTPDHPTYKSLFEKMYEINPEHNKIWRDVHNVWQWGITDEDLVNKLKELGFEQKFYKNCGRIGNLPNFENHSFVFRKV
jgi:hypothetical protein